MAVNSAELHALYGVILASESSWSEWSDIPGLEEEVNKDPTMLGSEARLENSLVLFYTCCCPKTLRAKETFTNIMKTFEG